MRGSARVASRYLYPGCMHDSAPFWAFNSTLILKDATCADSAGVCSCCRAPLPCQAHCQAPCRRTAWAAAALPHGPQCEEASMAANQALVHLGTLSTKCPLATAQGRTSTVRACGPQQCTSPQSRCPQGQFVSVKSCRCVPADRSCRCACICGAMLAEALGHRVVNCDNDVMC